ncbi:MAG: cyclic nucleotide-binding domain-containing protein [Deltaproteobacteria bacterium]|nr:cyclic nucleotide-binding domain-containing protein [Deltaproteobacteria bacterium]
MGLFDWLNKKPGEGGEQPGAAAPEDPDDADSAQIDAGHQRVDGEEKYVDEGQIARGGMGSIRRVFNHNLLRKEAMKCLDPKVAEDENELLRFIEEAQITAQLDHPNIPAVHDLGQRADGQHFFNMKLVRGKTLEQMLNNSRFKVNDDEQLFGVLQVFIKVCDAIAFAHSRSVIHCDLKPPNIMVGRFGQVYVMDWGIARVKGADRKVRGETGAELIQTAGRDRHLDDGRVMGTLGYMPPEQALGYVDQLDERSDVFALGALLYRILTGRAPHVGQTPEETWDLAKACQILPPQEMLEQMGSKLKLSQRLCQITSKALEADKELRYQSVAELQRDVEEYLRGAGRYPTATFPAGTLVIKQGDEGDAAYVITSGRARVFRTDGSGAGKTIRQLGPGEVFGETAILTSSPRSASIEAIEDLQCVVVARDALERELGQTFWVGHILKALAERFKDIDQRMEAEAKKLEPLVQDLVLRFFAFNGHVREDGARVVGWMLLRRHVRNTLKLGDVQTMALCAGVRGLHLDTASDEAVLVADPPGVRPGSGSMPAIPAAPKAPAVPKPPPRLESETLPVLSDKPTARPASRLGMQAISSPGTPRPGSRPMPVAAEPDTGEEPALSDKPARTRSGEVEVVSEAPVLSDRPMPRGKSGQMPALPEPSTGEEPVLSDKPTPRAKSGPMPAIEPPPAVEPAPSSRPPSRAIPSARPPSRAIPSARPPSRAIPSARPPSQRMSEVSTPSARPPSRPAPSVNMPRPPSQPSPVARTSPFEAPALEPTPAPPPTPAAEASPFAPTAPLSPFAPTPPTEAPPSAPAPEAPKYPDNATVADLPPEFAATELMPENMDIDALIAAASKAKAKLDGEGGGQGGGS